MKRIKNERLYQLNVGHRDALRYLVYNLFSIETGVGTVFPALRETGYYRGSVDHTVHRATVFCDVAHKDDAVYFRIQVNAPKVQTMLAAMTYFAEQFDGTGAVQTKTFPDINAHTPLTPGATPGGKPTRPLAESEQRIRVDIPDHPWNRRILPLVFDALTHHETLPDIPASLTLDVSHVEQTLDSQTGWHHLYITRERHINQQTVEETVTPLLAAYFIKSYVHSIED